MRCIPGFVVDFLFGNGIKINSYSILKIGYEVMTESLSV